MKKGPLILICLTAAFLCVLTGIYIGRNDTHIIRVNNKQTIAAVSSESKGKFDLNTVTASQLQQLPGIGEVIAQNIIDYRDLNGPYVTVEDLLNVEGIGKGRLETLCEYIYVAN